MAMQFIAMITEAKNQGVLIQTIALEGGNDFAHLLVGLEQAIIVMGNFFTDLRNVRVIGRYGNLGTVNHRGSAPAQFASL